MGLMYLGPSDKYSDLNRVGSGLVGSDLGVVLRVGEHVVAELLVEFGQHRVLPARTTGKEA